MFNSNKKDEEFQKAKEQIKNLENQEMDLKEIISLIRDYNKKCSTKNSDYLYSTYIPIKEVETDLDMIKERREELQRKWYGVVDGEVLKAEDMEKIIEATKKRGQL